MDPKEIQPAKRPPGRLKRAWMTFWAYLRTFYETGSLPRIEKLANSRFGKWVQGGGWPTRIWNFIRKILEFRLRYVRDTEVKGKVGDVKTVFTFWKRGWLGKVELLTLAAGALAIPLVMAWAAGSPQTEFSTPLMVVCLILFGLANGFAFSALLYARFPIFVIAGIYITYYTFYLGASLAFTPLFALASLWFLVLTWLMARADLSKWKYLWLALACLFVSNVTYGAFGLASLFVHQDWIPLWGLGTLYFGVICLLLFFQRNQKFNKPTVPFVFLGTILVLGLFFTLAMLKDDQRTGEITLLTAQSLLGLVNIFWMWLGATMVEGALGVGTRWSKEIQLFFGKLFARWIIPIGWGLTALFGWICTFEISPEMNIWTAQTGLSAWVNSWDLGLYSSVNMQVYISLAALATLGICRWMKKYTDDILFGLNGIWLACFVAMLGFYKAFIKTADLDLEAAPPDQWWLVLLLVFGLVWELAKAGESYWKVEAPGRHLGVVAILEYVFAISIITLGVGLSDVTVQNKYYSFMGILYFGVPLLILMALQKLGYQPVQKSNLLILVAVGAVSAIPPLIINLYGDGSMALAPFIWLVILGLWGKKLARLTGWLDAVLAGGALGTGFAMFWMSPEIIPVPFLTFWADIQDSYYYEVHYIRHPLYMEHLWITLGAIGAGVLVSLLIYGFYRRKNSPPELMPKTTR